MAENLSGAPGDAEAIPATPVPPAPVSPTTAPPAQPAVPASPLDQAVGAARGAGWSWNDITDKLQTFRAAASQAGYSNEELDKFLGYNEPGRPLFGLDPEQHVEPGAIEMGAIGSGAQQGAQFLHDVAHSGGAFLTGLKQSASGLTLTGTPPTPEALTAAEQTEASHIANLAGQTLGDLPWNLLGGAVGAVVGAPAGPVGATAGAGFGAMALPAAIREAYAQSFAKGEITGPADFADRAAAVLWQATKQGLPGAVAGPVGKAVGFATGSTGVQLLSEAATMLGVSSAIQKQLPTWQDTIDAGISILAMHGLSKTPEMIGQVKTNLLNHWAQTGESPTDAAKRAASDPALQQQLVLPPNPPIKTGTSVTPALPHGDTGPDGHMAMTHSMPTAGAVDLMQGLMGKDQTDPAIQTFIQRGGQKLDPNNWCADFVNAALEQEGIKGSGSSVATSFLKWGEPVTGAPDKGDVVVISRGHAVGETGGHVGIATGQVEGDRIQMISGNGSNNGKVSLSWVKMGDVAIRRSAEGSNIAYTPEDVTQGTLEKFRVLEGSADDAVSPAGAVGRYQIMPDTAKQYGFDPERLKDPVYSERVARAILSDLSKRYQGDQDAMAVAYNAGPGVADRWLASGRDPKELSKETLAYLDHLHRLNGGINFVEGTVKPEEQLPIEPKIEPEDLVEQGKELGYTEEDLAHLMPAEEEEVGSSVGAAQVNPTAKPSMAPADIAARADALMDTDSLQPGLGQRIRDWADRAYKEFLHYDHPLNQIQNRWEDQSGRQLEGWNNPKWIRRIIEAVRDTSMYNVVKEQIDLNGQRIGASLQDIIKPIMKGTGMRDFQRYAIARMTMHDASYAKETGMSIDDARHWMDLHGERMSPIYEQLLNFRNNTLRLLNQGGMLSAEDYANLVGSSFGPTDALPLYRLQPETKTAAGRSRSMIARKQVFEKQGNAELPIKNVVGSVMQDLFARRQMALRNLHNQAVIKITREMGLSEKVGKTLTKITPTPEEVARMGGDPAEIEDLFRTRNPALSKNDMIVWRDGQPEAERFLPNQAGRFTGSQIRENLEGMNHFELSTVDKLFSYVANVARRGITATVEFPVRILGYDALFRPTVDPGFRNSLATIYHGLRVVLGTDNATWEKFLRSPAAEGIFRGVANDHYWSQLLAGKDDPAFGWTAREAITSPLRWIDRYSAAITSIMPAGRLRQGLRAGESEARAGVAAQAMRFHRPAETGNATRRINAMIPFFAAHVQGLDTFVRAALTGGKHITEGEYSRTATWIKGATIITSLMVTNYLAHKDDPVYQAAPDWMKMTGLVYTPGGQTVYIPIAPPLGLLFGGIPNMLLSHFLDQHPSALGPQIKDALTQTLVPPGAGYLGGPVSAAVQIMANHSFMTGRPIVPDSQSQLIGPEQYAPWSSGLARSLSQGLYNLGVNVSPRTIDFGVQAFGGTIGKDVVQGADALFHTGPYTPGTMDRELGDIPVIGSFVRRNPGMSAQPIENFMQRADSVTKLHNSVENALKHGDVDAAIRELNEPGGDLKAFRFSKMGKFDIGTAMSQQDVQRFAAAVQDRMTKMSPDRLQAVQQFYTDADGLHKLRDYVNAEITPSNKSLTPMDKRQLYDQAAKFMIQKAQDGLTALDKLGVQ